eukprot:7945170-Heterocapsa_arctica.AAC.1
MTQDTINEDTRRLRGARGNRPEPFPPSRARTVFQHLLNALSLLLSSHYASASKDGHRKPPTLRPIMLKPSSAQELRKNIIL